MLPIVSAGLTMARVMHRLTIPEVTKIAGMTPDEVFDAENFLNDVHPVSVQLIAMAPDVDLTKLIDLM